MSVDTERRFFVKASGSALGLTAAIGAGFAGYAMKKTWDPLPSVKAAGTTKVDLSTMTEGELQQVVFRGKPVFILKKPASVGTNDKRDVIVDGARFTVNIAICTHLGCIPAFNSNDFKFTCACHGGVFDVSGVNTFGPPPSPMVIPPFKIEGSTLVLGEEGPEYQKLLVAFQSTKNKEA